MTSLRDFHAIVVVADERHFGRAADRLGMAQPQLSALVRRVEESAAIRIFTRRPRVAPTYEGEIYIDAARRVLREAKEGLDLARAAARGQTGIVRVGVAPTFMLTDLVTAFAAYRRLAPEVEVALRELHSGPIWEALVAGAIDVGLTREVRVAEGVRAVQVLRDPFVAVLPEGHPLTAMAAIRVSDLSSEPFVLSAPQSAPNLHAQIIALCAGGGFSPRVAFEVDAWSSILALVRCGFGVSLVSRSLSRLNVPGVAFRRLLDASETTVFWLAWNPGRLNKAAASLCDRIQEQAQALSTSP